MRIFTLPGVFRPHSDTWMLAELVGADPRLPGARVLDLCTGSGALAIAAALGGAASVTAVDLSRRSVLTTRMNARLNGVRVSARRGDLFEAVAGERFDLIVSNPPYLPSAESELPRSGRARAWEGGPGGRALLDRIAGEAADHLRPGGALWLVHSSVCEPELTLDRLSAAGLPATVERSVRGPVGPLLRERMPTTLEEDLVAIRAAA